jgi:hypothetical protein
MQTGVAGRRTAQANPGFALSQWVPGEARREEVARQVPELA